MLIGASVNPTPSPIRVFRQSGALTTVRTYDDENMPYGGYGNFDIVMGPLLTWFSVHPPPNPHYYAYWILIGACNLMS